MADGKNAYTSPPGGPDGQQQQQPQQYAMQPGQQPQQYAMQPGQQPQQYAMQPGQQPQQYAMQPGQQPQQYAMQPGQQQYMMQPGQQQMMMAPGQQQMMMQQGQQQMMMQQGQQQMMMAPGQQQMMMQPMMMQPSLWMPRPVVMEGIPPGLEYLTQLNQLLVKQQIEMMEVLTNFEMKNRYIIRNIMGQQVYYAHEESGCCERQCCGPRRPFTMHIEDNMGTEVIQIIRPYKWMCYGQCCSCSECCQDEVEIQAPPGEKVGAVKQMYEGCDIMYAIKDANDQTVLTIKGPSYFHCYCPGDDVPFQLLTANMTDEVGKISKQWSNLMREYFTDADNFGIQFPMDLDVRIKAVILGAVFLIDFMFFETNQRRAR